MRVTAFVVSKGVTLLLGCALALGYSVAIAPETRAQDITSNQSARKITSKVLPEYPAVARQLKLQGKVKIEVIVSADGHVIGTNVVGGHPTLADAAERAVKKWRFEPATKDSTEIIEIVFTGRN